MKYFLGTLGKITTSIKKEGVLEAARKTISGVGKILLPAKAGDVLYITGGGVGASAHYRCYNQAEELSLHGLKASVVTQGNFFLKGAVEKNNVFIFHRVIFDEKIRNLIEKIKRENKMILFETDDLNYDPEYVRKTNYYQNATELEKRSIGNGIGSEILSDGYVQNCVTTTNFIARKLEEKGKNVFISRNKLSNKELDWAEKISNKKQKSEEEVIIGYFSGTASHDEDFATVSNPILSILKKYENVKLLIAGPLKLGSEFAEFSEKIIRKPLTSRKKNYENIAGVDINIAPLVIGDDFCEAKSEIKFVEAGVVSTPTIAAATGVYQSAISDGHDGMLAFNEKDWEEKLGKFIEYEELRKQMGARAKEKIIAEYTNKNSHNDEYYNFLKQSCRKK